MRICFIGGTGRCGTSVMKRALDMSKETISYKSELRVLTDPGGLLDCLDTLEHHWTPFTGTVAVTRLFQVLADYSPELPAIATAALELDGKLSELTGTQWGYGTQVQAEAFHETEPISIYTAERIAAFFMCDVFQLRYSAIETTPESKLILDDTPSNALRSHLLLRYFPEARFVFMYRDAKQTARSMIRHRRAERWWPPTYELALRRVSATHEKMRQARSDSFWRTRIIPVDLEELRDTPETMMRTVLKRLGLTWTERVLEPIEPSRVTHYEEAG